MLRLLAGLALMIAPAAAGAAAAAAPVIPSPAPDRVAVTLYRDPNRGSGAIDRNEPASFALISETRTVTLPPGVVTIRFEGVASGIVPQSAILIGTDPRERNRDAALLSQTGLVDAFTGQQVILRRTDLATGKTTEERATIRSAANRLVIQTPRGAEAVYCSGLAQTLIYPEAPATLSAKPVLTMTTKHQPGGRITITLAYIANGFDWDATYVASLASDGKSLALFAWLTMASGDDTSFVDATTSAVAGRISRSGDTERDLVPEARSLNRSAQCWPARTTSDIDSVAAAAPMSMTIENGDIVVTATRRNEALSDVPLAVSTMMMSPMLAVAEDLGDLKLYRIPERVTVAARSQKQVAFLDRPRVDGALVSRSVVWDAPGEPQLLFRFRNRKQDGLGDPLPAGKAIVYQAGPLGRQLVGQSIVADKTTDEEVELVLGEAQNVTVESKEEKAGNATRYAVTLRNANPFAVSFELEFRNWVSNLFSGLPAHLLAKPGKRVWAIPLPANGERRITYQVRGDGTRDEIGRIAVHRKLADRR